MLSYRSPAHSQIVAEIPNSSGNFSDVSTSKSVLPRLKNFSELSNRYEEWNSKPRISCHERKERLL